MAGSRCGRAESNHRGLTKVHRRCDDLQVGGNEKE
jgi:hypothetical protein